MTPAAWCRKELAHVLLPAPGQRPADLTRPQAEVEAESVAYVVSAAHGLDSSTYTVPYVVGWAGTDPTLVARAAARVLSPARDVLQPPPPPPALALPEHPRDLLRCRDRSDTPARLAREQRDAPSRDREPAGSLADRSRLTRSGQLTPASPETRSPASRGNARDAQGPLW